MRNLKREKEAGAIVIAGGSSGFGHMKVANNLTEWFSEIDHSLEVKAINIFDFLSSPLRYVFEELWEFSSLHLGCVYRRFHHILITYRALTPAISRLFAKSADNFRSAFAEDRISAFVATHPAAAVLGSLVARELDFVFCVVPTDFVVHNFQVFPSVDYYYVPPEATLVGRVTESERFQKRSVVTGIPLSKRFSVEADTGALCKQLRLSPERLTVLVSFGCKGFTAERNIKLLHNLTELDLPLQFLIVTGQNHIVKRHLQEILSKSANRNTVKILGLVQDMAELMDVSDIFMGKPGGLSTSEALAKGLPIAVLDLLPGVEDFNLRLITRNELGIKVADEAHVVDWVRSLLQPGNLSSLKRRVRTFGRPLSGFHIASHISSVIADLNRKSPRLRSSDSVGPIPSRDTLSGNTIAGVPFGAI